LKMELRILSSKPPDGVRAPTASLPSSDLRRHTRHELAALVHLPTLWSSNG
jgi:hypothetical protein